MDFPTILNAADLVTDLVEVMADFLVEYLWLGLSIFFGILGIRWLGRSSALTGLGVGGAVVGIRRHTHTPPPPGGGGGSGGLGEKE